MASIIALDHLGPSETKLVRVEALSLDCPLSWHAPLQSFAAIEATTGGATLILHSLKTLGRRF